MPSIRARKGRDGRVSYTVQVRLAGFPAQTETFARKTDAREWAASTESALREGRFFPAREAKRHTVADLAERYLESVKRRRPHAHRKQKQIMDWWSAKLGDYALAGITPAIIAEKRDELLAENIGTKERPLQRAPATANRYLAALSKAMSDAVREYHWLHDNPVRRVAKETESRGRVRCLTDDERARLLSACQQSELEALPLIVMLALTTGMRQGEILGLRWGDIDMARGLAVLHRTKNSDRRGVPLVPAVVGLLREHAKVRRLGNDLVFAGRGDGKPLRVDRAFRVAVRAAKVEDFRFHDLRHTAASYLAMTGATSAEIAAVLGHRTLAMVKRYTHIGDSHSGAVVERMARRYFGDGTT